MMLFFSLHPLSLTRHGRSLALASLLLAVPAAAQDPLNARWSEPIEVAAGGGHRGPWQQNESTYDYVDDPAVALHEDGTAAVAWVDQAQKDVFLQLFSPDGRPQLDHPVNVSRSPAIFSWLPRLVVSRTSARHLYILWQEIVFAGGSHGGDILFARSVDGGRTFSPPINLSRSLEGEGKGRIDAETWDNGSLDLVQDVAGNLFAAWTSYEGTLSFSRSTDQGASFSAPIRVAGSATQPVRAPSLAAGGAGTLYLAWTVGDDPAGNLRLAKTTDGGRTFREARVVAESTGYSDAPKIAVDRRGVVHLVYAERTSSPAPRSVIRYTRSTDGGDMFAPAREISGRPSSAGGLGQGFPHLALDREGRIFVIWEAYPDSRDWSRGLGGTFSNDGGRRFAPPQLLPPSRDAAGNNGSQQGLLMQKLAVNPTGAIAVVNSSFRPGERSRVWLLRGQAAR